MYQRLRLSKFHATGARNALLLYKQQLDSGRGGRDSPLRVAQTQVRAGSVFALAWPLRATSPFSPLSAGSSRFLELIVLVVPVYAATPGAPDRLRIIYPGQPFMSTLVALRYLSSNRHLSLPRFNH